MPDATARPDHGTTAPVIRARSRLARLASTPIPAIRLTPPLLRTPGGHHRDERRSSWLELFFDLVFAGAVSQLAGALQDHPSLGTLARFVMLFTPIWWLTCIGPVLQLARFSVV